MQGVVLSSPAREEQWNAPIDHRVRSGCGAGSDRRRVGGPDGDPWLAGKSCAVTSTVNQLWSGAAFKGPFPLTRDQVPASQRLAMLIQAFPLAITAPAPGQSIAQGGTVTVQLKKGLALAKLPVLLKFKRVAEGDWAPASAFEKQTINPSMTVGGYEFKQPGVWKVTAEYTGSGLQPQKATERTFEVVAGGGGGGWPAPGSGGSGDQSAGARSAAGGGGSQAPKVVLPVQKGGPLPPVEQEPRPRVSLAAPRDPPKLVSSAVRGPSALALQFQNPEGDQESPAHAVELRLAGKVVGRGSLGRLPAGRGAELVLSYALPPGTRGPVQLEIWVGSQKLGVASVTPGLPASR